jgi:hypothetical protein
MTRDADGHPLCSYCLVNDPINLEECVRCRRRQRVSTRGPDGPVCGSCVPRRTAECSVCGQTVPWMISTITGGPGAAMRQTLGDPRSPRHRAHRIHCSRCGQLSRIRAGTRDQPLCATCALTDDVTLKACTGCGTDDRLIIGACRRCHLNTQLDELLIDPANGQIRPDLQAFGNALADVERPESALAWIRAPQ